MSARVGREVLRDRGDVVVAWLFLSFPLSPFQPRQPREFPSHRLRLISADPATKTNSFNGKCD